MERPISKAGNKARPDLHRLQIFTPIPLSQNVDLVAYLRQDTLHDPESSAPSAFIPQTPTLPILMQPPEQKNENVPHVSKNWQHFTFICDKTIVSKNRAIADREGFSIRELIKHILANAITSYESKY